jgi:hypothetical protein
MILELESVWAGFENTNTIGWRRALVEPASLDRNHRFLIKLA